MKQTTIALGIFLTMFTASGPAQAPVPPKPAPELKALEVWVGEWRIEGQVQDKSSEPAHEVVWTVQCQWIAGGFFLECLHHWKSPKSETVTAEIIGFEPSRKNFVSREIHNNGSSYLATATFREGVFTIGGTTWRNSFTFSSDGRSLSWQREFQEAGSWRTVANGKGVKTRPADAATLREIEADWVKANNARNAERIASYFAPDGVRCSPNAPMEKGPEEILNAQKQVFARPGPVPTVANELRLIEVARSADLAVTHGTYAESGVGSDGRPAADKGKWVTVYRKQPDGAWKVVLDIGNSDLPAPAKP